MRTTVKPPGRSKMGCLSDISECAVSDDIQRVEQLFQAAADLPLRERTAYLDRECGEDEAMKSHVRRLLNRLGAATVDNPGNKEGDNDGLHVPVSRGAADRGSWHRHRSLQVTAGYR